MHATIITGGKIDDFKKIKNYIKHDDFIICADSGYNHAEKMGIKPDILVGDFDSINKPYELIKGCKIEKFPVKKDKTDTELAVDIAVRNGAKEITLIGATGTRYDHSLANIALLFSLRDKKIKARIIDDNNIIYAAEKNNIISGTVGDLLSLIPFSNCLNISAVGLEYVLENENLNFGSTKGISNVFSCDKAVITVGSGNMLIIKSVD